MGKPPCVHSLTPVGVALEQCLGQRTALIHPSPVGLSPPLVVATTCFAPCVQDTKRGITDPDGLGDRKAGQDQEANDDAGQAEHDLHNTSLCCIEQTSHGSFPWPLIFVRFTPNELWARRFYDGIDEVKPNQPNAQPPCLSCPQIARHKRGSLA